MRVARDVAARRRGRRGSTRPIRRPTSSATNRAVSPTNTSRPSVAGRRYVHSRSGSSMSRRHRSRPVAHVDADRLAGHRGRDDRVADHERCRLDRARRPDVPHALPCRGVERVDAAGARVPRRRTPRSPRSVRDHRPGAVRCRRSSRPSSAAPVAPSAATSATDRLDAHALAVPRDDAPVRGR